MPGSERMDFTPRRANTPWEDGLDQFAACWEGLEDPRTGNAGLHDFHELLMIALCTVLCGGQGAVDMALFARAKEPFLRGFLKLANGLPSHDTFSRLFRLLDPVQFHAAFQRFMARFSETLQGVVAIDGKVLRRSFDQASGKSPLHMVSAWGCEQRMVLAQIATDAKSNEITAVPKLLRMLSLKGTIVTTDALNCQRAIAQQIVDQGGDYVLALKGNQGTLHDDVTHLSGRPAAKITAAKPASTPITAASKPAPRRSAPRSVAGRPSLARPRGDRQGGPHSRDHAKTTIETAYYLLSSALSAGAFQRRRPLPLGRREPAALAPRCGDERRPGPQPTGPRPGKPGRAPAHGAERHAEGRNQGLAARQVQASRMG